MCLRDVPFLSAIRQEMYETVRKLQMHESLNHLWIEEVCITNPYHGNRRRGHTE